jgi:succinylglutamate desuccinylase
MKRRIVAVCLAVSLLLAGTGCSGADKTMDMDGFCSKVFETVKYDDELVRASDRTAQQLYDLSFDGLEEYEIYVSGTLATANELTVMKLANADAVAAARKSIESRISDQTSNYENYRPDELFRIKNAIIVEKGNYILFSVSEDNETVKKLFEDSLK